MTSKDPLELEQLSDYDIVGELSGRDDARAFLATRKQDHAGVLITVWANPAGDEGNALSHLAADSRLLGAQSHRNVLPVLDGRWVGESFAVVTERPAAPTLDELLTRREEAFGYPRIAAILRQLNAALEWSRAQRVVHRALRLDCIYVEPGSDEVRVTFAARALPANALPSAAEDAATIAYLARAMLTRSPIAPERDRRPLSELRPGLPARVLEQTGAFIGGVEGPVPDVSEYIAAIAMSEELKRGEDECERVITEMTEEQRVTREELLAERKAHEEDLAAQALAFQQEKEAARRAFEKEKQDAQRAFEKETQEAQRALEKEKEASAKAVARERERMRRALEREREALAKERAELARERAAFAKEAHKAREQIAAKFAALDSQARLYDRTAELPLPDREVAIAPSLLAPPVDRPAVPAPRDEPYDEILEEPEDAYVVGAATRRQEASPRPAREGSDSRWWKRMWASRSGRATGLAAVGLLGVVGAASLALGSRNDDRSRRVEEIQPPPLRTMDSASGSVGRPYVVPNAVPTTTVDTSAAPDGGTTAPRYLSPEPASTRPPESPQRDEPYSPGTPVQSTPTQVPAEPVTPPIAPAPWFTPLGNPEVIRRDSVRQEQPVRVEPLPPDTAARRDTTTTRLTPIAPAPALPLTFPRVDTLRPDSTKATPPR